MNKLMILGLLVGGLVSQNSFGVVNAKAEDQVSVKIMTVPVESFYPEKDIRIVVNDCRGNTCYSPGPIDQREFKSDKGGN